MKWPEGDKTHPGHLLIHALGPVVGSPTQIDDAQQVIYHAYKGIFEAAAKSENKPRVVQMPLLSDRIYAQRLEPAAYELWRQRNLDAFWKAATEALNSGQVEGVVLVDRDQIPTV